MWGYDELEGMNVSDLPPGCVNEEQRHPDRSAKTEVGGPTDGAGTLGTLPTVHVSRALELPPHPM